jgi:hypothetical protein
MPRIMSITAELEWPAEKVWPIVSDFGGLKRWNPAILSCESTGQKVGGVRTFSSAVATVQERIDALDDAAMRIRYTIVSGSTIKVRDGQLEISVTRLDPDRSQISWTMDGEPDGMPLEELTALTTKRYTGRIEDLRRCLAAGSGG